MKRTFKITSLLVLIASMLVIFYGCSGEPAPADLAAYFDKHQDIMGVMDQSAKKESTKEYKIAFSVSGNTLNYTRNYTSTLSDKEVKKIQDDMKDKDRALYKQLKKLKKNLEQQTSVSGITIHMEYKNGDGSTIYSQDFK